MATFINELRGFQPIPRSLIESDELSKDARFLYCLMAVKPDDWEYFEAPLKAQLGISSSRTFRKYRDELIRTGWLECVGQATTADGRFSANTYRLKAAPSIRVDDGDSINTPADVQKMTNGTDVQKMPHGKECRTAKSAQLTKYESLLLNTHSSTSHTHTAAGGNVSAETEKTDAFRAELMEEPNAAKKAIDKWLADKCPDVFMLLQPLTNKQADLLLKEDRLNMYQIFMEMNGKAIRYQGRTTFDVWVTFRNSQFKRNNKKKKQ